MLLHVPPLCSPKLTRTVRVFYLLLSCCSPHFLLTPCLCSVWNCPNQYASALSNQVLISSQCAIHKWLTRQRSHHSALPVLDWSSLLISVLVSESLHPSGNQHQSIRVVIFTQASNTTYFSNFQMETLYRWWGHSPSKILPGAWPTCFMISKPSIN